MTSRRRRVTFLAMQSDRVKRVLLLIAEVSLVVVIVVLLALIWLPAIVGSRPGSLIR